MFIHSTVEYAPGIRFRIIFWSKGYVNTVGINEDMIKRYVKYQEDEERKEEQDEKDFMQIEPGI